MTINYKHSKLSLLIKQGEQLMNLIPTLNHVPYPPQEIPHLTIMKDLNTTSSNFSTILNIGKKTLPDKDQITLDKYSKRIMTAYEEVWIWIERFISWIEITSCEIINTLWVIGLKITNQEKYNSDNLGSNENLGKKIHILRETDILPPSISLIDEIMRAISLLCKLLLGIEHGSISNLIEKIILYNLSYKSISSNGKGHSTYTRIQNFMEKYKKGIIFHLQTLFPESIEDVMCILLNQLILICDQYDIRKLKSELTLEILSREKDISIPAIDDVHFNLSRIGDIEEWLLISLLVFPKALYWDERTAHSKLFNEKLNQSLQSASIKKIKPIKLKKIKLKTLTRQLDFLRKKLLSTTFLISLGADFCIPVIDLYKHAFSLDPVLKKKKLIKKMENLSIRDAQFIHAEFRSTNIKYLQDIYFYIQENPAVISSKFQLILALMSHVKKETLWYLRHANQLKQSQNLTNEGYLQESIYILEELTSFILQHQNIIQNYVVKLLKNINSNDIVDAIEQLKQSYHNFYKSNEGVMEEVEFQSIYISNLYKISKSISQLDESNISNINFDEIRNMCREWLYLICESNNLGMFLKDNALSLVIYIDRIFTISKQVDQISDLLLTHCGLHEFFYHHSQIKAIFYETIKNSSSQSRFSLSIIKLFGFFLENAHPNLSPALREKLGRMSILYSYDSLEYVAVTFSQFLSRYISCFCGNNSQIFEASRALLHLTFSICENQSLEISNAIFFPVEFLKKQVELVVFQQIKEFLSYNNDIKQKKLKLTLWHLVSPSQILNRCKSMIEALSILEEILEMDASKIVEKCLLEFFSKQIPFETKSENIFISDANSLELNHIIDYTNILIKQVLILSDKDGISYNHCASYFKGDFLISQKEIEAFITLFGIHTGYIIIDRISDYIIFKIKNLNESLITQDNFNILYSKLSNGEDSSISQKEIQIFQNSIDLLVHIGSLLELSRIIFESIKSIEKNSLPILKYTFVQNQSILLNNQMIAGRKEIHDITSPENTQIASLPIVYNFVLELKLPKLSILEVFIIRFLLQFEWKNSSRRSLAIHAFLEIVNCAYPSDFSKWRFKQWYTDFEVWIQNHSFKVL